MKSEEKNGSPRGYQERRAEPTGTVPLPGSLAVYKTARGRRGISSVRLGCTKRPAGDLIAIATGWEKTTEGFPGREGAGSIPSDRLGAKDLKNGGG